MSPRNRWVGIIVGLLLGNVAAGAVLIAASSGDTGRRVLPDYYQRAAAWDRTMTDAAASARLGWSATVRAHGRVVELTVRDASGAPLVGAAVTVRGWPRGRADEPVAATLVATAPGGYRATVPGARGGLHDVVITIERGPDRWSADRVVELGAGLR